MGRLRVSAKSLGDGEALVQLTQAMDKALDPAVLQSVAEAGAKVVEDKAASIVQTTAKHPTGTLAGAIGVRGWAGTTSAGAMIGWEQKKIKRSHGVGGRHSYRDRSGRGRSVNTVADYARILEYSERRQLRHMDSAWDQTEEAALDEMESRLDALLQQAGL